MQAALFCTTVEEVCSQSLFCSASAPTDSVLYAVFFSALSLTQNRLMEIGSFTNLSPLQSTSLESILSNSAEDRSDESGASYLTKTARSTGNQTCHPTRAPFCAPGLTFFCPGVTFLWPLVTVLRPRGIFLCPACRGQLFVLLVCYTTYTKSSSTPHIYLFRAPIGALPRSNDLLGAQKGAPTGTQKLAPGHKKVPRPGQKQPLLIFFFFSSSFS